MRYYEREHFDAYARIRREGLDQWSDLHTSDCGRGYDDFSNRSFLARMLPADEQHRSTVLEYGCGTGGTACFLAERGYRVHAIDLVPDAIEVARLRAAQRGLSVRFEVEDICRWGEPEQRYDYVIDSFCLQSIVTDEDRSRVLHSVRKRLNPGGRYLLSTAMYSPDREYGPDHFDVDTGIEWAPAAGPSVDGMIRGGSWYVPHRRHLRASALRAELEQHGFRVVEQSEPSGGDVVSELASAGGTSAEA